MKSVCPPHEQARSPGPCPGQTPSLLVGWSLGGL